MRASAPSALLFLSIAGSSGCAGDEALAPVGRTETILAGDASVRATRVVGGRVLGHELPRSSAGKIVYEVRWVAAGRAQPCWRAISS